MCQAAAIRHGVPQALPFSLGAGVASAGAKLHSSGARFSGFIAKRRAWRKEAGAKVSLKAVSKRCRPRVCSTSDMTVNLRLKLQLVKKVKHS